MGGEGGRGEGRWRRKRRRMVEAEKEEEKEERSGREARSGVEEKGRGIFKKNRSLFSLQAKDGQNCGLGKGAKAVMTTPRGAPETNERPVSWSRVRPRRMYSIPERVHAPLPFHLVGVNLVPMHSSSESDR